MKTYYTDVRIPKAGVAGKRNWRTLAMGLFLTATMTGCAATPYAKTGVAPAFTFPVTSNETPYTQCLNELQTFPANNLPTFTVGEIADKTGQINYDENGHVVTQGITEMVISAFYKTGKANLIERFDLRIPLAELKMVQQGLTNQKPTDYKLRTSDFVILGALTELNYNIVSDGIGLWVEGIGAGARTVVINVALDVRVVDSKSFEVRYVSTLQKQIYGFEVEANVFRFFGNSLVEFDAGRVQNEPLQLGVRSVVEMGVYQIMTDFLGLPKSEICGLVETDHMKSKLNDISQKEN